MNYTSLLNLQNSANEVSGEWKVYSPAKMELGIGVCQYRYSDIELAIKGCALAPVARTVRERLAHVENARAELLNHKTALLSVAMLELGRNESELETEWQALLTYVESMLGDATLAAKQTDSRGISVVLGSYVWPLFYTTQFALMNYVAGNPVIVKPSEKATLTAHALVQVLRNVPELHAIQLLVGEREVGRRLATHEAVSTLLFQGSFEVGMRVKQDALSQPGKEVLLYLGSKNPAIVFADAKPDVEDALIRDCFLSAGQHCRSLSVIFVENSRLETFRDRFHDRAKLFKIGAPESNPFMGPLIDGAMLDRYLKFIGISEREGAEVVMRGKPFTQSEKGHYVTPSIACFSEFTAEKMRKSVSLQTEILSPHVSIVGFADEAELQSLLEQMTHGKLVSVWTSDLARAKRIAQATATGEVLINQSIFEFNPWVSTQARKRSGNHARLGRDLFDQLTFQKYVHA